MCDSVLDHEWGPETLDGREDHPVVGPLVRIRQTCDHCGQVRRATRRQEVSAYGLAPRSGMTTQVGS
jgi:hypothetical protein